MNILLMLVPISIVLLGIAIWAFAWAVRKGQFDDLDTPALDILADDPRPLPSIEAAEAHPLAPSESTPAADPDPQPPCRST